MNGVIEIGSSNNLSCLLTDNNDFFEVGFKVMQSQSTNCFVKTYKTYNNGKIKFIYDIGRYESLERFLMFTREDIFIKVMINIFNSVGTIGEIGYIGLRNIKSQAKSIFIDENVLQVKYIYIPLNNGEGKSEKEFLEELKVEILKGIRRNNNLNLIFRELEDIFSRTDNVDTMNYELANLEKKIKNIFLNRKSNIRNEKENIECIENFNPKLEKRVEEVIKLPKEENKKSRFKGLKGLFGKKEETYREQVIENKREIRTIEEGTCVLEEESKGAVLIGVSTVENFEININKPNFIIGAHRDMADGIITFNRAISRKHCRILNQGNKYFVEDLNSSNGTFVNNREIGKEPSEIRDGDILKVANLELMFKRI